MLKLFAVLCVFLLSQPAHAERQLHAMVLSGVVLEQGNNKLSASFTHWLAKKSGYSLSVVYAESYQDLSTKLREHPECVAWTCGAPFVEDHVNDHQQLVAVPLFHGKPTYYSLVVTRSGREEKKLMDFEGGVFAYSDPRSNSGFVAPAYMFKQKGIDISTYFRHLMRTGLHEYSIEAVLAGVADVANIDEYVLVEYLKLHPKVKKQLVVLEKFGPFPFTPIVAGSEVSQKVMTQLQQTLLHMDKDPEGKVILQKLGLDGFVLKKPSFYQPIDMMLKALK